MPGINGPADVAIVVVLIVFATAFAAALFMGNVDFFRGLLTVTVFAGMVGSHNTKADQTSVGPACMAIAIAGLGIMTAVEESAKRIAAAQGRTTELLSARVKKPAEPKGSEP